MKYDGNRIISTWMQFPDSAQMQLSQIPNIFFNFHTAAPGLPIIYTLLYTAFGSSWETVALGGTYILGIFAGISLIKQSTNLKIKREFLVIILLIGIAANPSVILFDHQFYSTSLVLYLLIIFVSLGASAKFESKKVVQLTLILILLTFIRPTFSIFFVLILLCLILTNYKQHSKKYVSLIMVLLLPLAIAQGFRIIEFGSFSFNSNASTGLITGLGYDNLNGTSYARQGYYPYKEREGKLALKTGSNWILDEPVKGNGLPNWNYRGYLEDFQNDQRHMPKVLLYNLDQIPSYFVHSLKWVSIDPTCSRVILIDSRSHLADYSNAFNSVFELNIGPVFTSSEMPACYGSTRLGLTYPILLFVAIFLYFRLLYAVVFRKEKSSRAFAIVFAPIIFASLASFANGSPEMSKYRVEHEFLLLIFIATQHLHLKKLLSKFNWVSK